MDKDGKVRPRSNPDRQDEIQPSFPSHPCPFLSLQPLQPVVHVWDSETLLKLQEIGLGAFERGVGALAFSVVVSWPKASGPTPFLSESPLLIRHQEASDVLAFLTPARPAFLRREHVLTSCLPACGGVSCLMTMNSQPLPSLSPSTLSPSSGSGCFSLCGG